MWQLIKDAISGVAAFLRLKEKADDRANTPTMQANARAAQDAKIRDASTAAVKADSLDEIRRRAAE